MVTSGKSSGNAAENPPAGRSAERSAAGPDPSADKSFTDNFGEVAELQDRVIHDRTIVVERDGASVLTDSPREGDLPQSAAQLKTAEEERAAGRKAAREDSRTETRTESRTESREGSKRE